MARWWVVPVRIFRLLVDIFTDFVYKLIYGVNDVHQIQLPRIESKLILEPAHVLARMIRENEVTSVEVVQAFIQRIKDVNPTINCAVDTRYPAMFIFQKVNICDARFHFLMIQV